MATALVGTVADATIAQLWDAAINHPADGIQLYTDVGQAPTSSEVAAGTLYSTAVRAKINGVNPIFNNVDMTKAHIAAYSTDGLVVMLKRVGVMSSNKSQLLYQILGGTYNNDYVRHENVEFLR